MSLDRLLESGLGRKGSISLVDHVQLIRAILLRNIRLKNLKQPSGFLAEFLRPSVICVAHYFVFWAIGKQMPAGIAIEQFVWAAFTVWLTFNQIYTGLQLPLWAKAPPIPGATTMHARVALAVWATMSNITFCYISIFLMILFGDDIAIPNLPLTVVILLLAATLGFGLGLFVEAVCRQIPALYPIFHLLPYFLFITTGVYYSVATTPPAITPIFLYAPLLHLIEYERYAFESGYPTALVSLSYPAVCAACCLLIGLAVSRRVRHKALA